MSTVPTPATQPGTLYLVPAPLDFGCDSQTPLDQVMPAGTLAVAASLQHWVCENAKSTRFDARPLLQAALQGHSIGLVSEAGMPAVADPGSSVVRAAHALDISVVPLVGPVSLLLALAASGLNGQNFAFVGYVPNTPAERTQRIRELEALATQTGQTQLFIETPYRNTALLQSLLQTLQPHTRLATASGITLAQATYHSDTVQHWKRRAWVLENATPTVFAIGR